MYLHIWELNILAYIYFHNLPYFIRGARWQSCDCCRLASIVDKDRSQVHKKGLFPCSWGIKMADDDLFTYILLNFKVSQRTHKCQAQPPGMVIRQSGELVEKLKKKLPDNIATQSVEDIESNRTSDYQNVSESSVELIRSSAKLSLEDTESEHFALISESFENVESESNNIMNSNNHQNNNSYLNTSIEDLINTVPSDDKNVPSPSEILKNLCLSHDDEPQNDVNYQEIFREFNNFL